MSTAPARAATAASRSTRRHAPPERPPEAGVRHAWLVNPLVRTLEVMRLEAERWLLLGVFKDDARVRAEPFEAFELELAILWADVELPPEPAP